MTREDRRLSFGDIVQIVEGFIEKFWECVAKRMEHTDTECDITSFSEAPAESFFSKWEFVTNHRPSLKPSNVISLCRIMLEGPVPGTVVSHDLTRKALTLWEGHLGERFTTQKWDGISVSKTVRKCQNKVWKYSCYSNLDID